MMLPGANTAGQFFADRDTNATPLGLEGSEAANAGLFIGTIHAFPLALKSTEKVHDIFLEVFSRAFPSHVRDRRFYPKEGVAY
jgi:hypothetical protein